MIPRVHVAHLMNQRTQVLGDGLTKLRHLVIHIESGSHIRHLWLLWCYHARFVFSPFGEWEICYVLISLKMSCTAERLRLQACKGCFPISITEPMISFHQNYKDVMEHLNGSVEGAGREILLTVLNTSRHEIERTNKREKRYALSKILHFGFNLPEKEAFDIVLSKSKNIWKLKLYLPRSKY